MKKTIFSIVLMAVCLCANAQSFGEASTKDGMMVKYVQLWAGGPKFAKINLGAEISSYTGAKAYDTKNTGWYFSWGCNQPMHCEYYAETSMTNLIGDMDPTIHYWGKNWRTPNSEELFGLANADKVDVEWCDGETKQYVPGCRIAGFKVSGKDDYSEHNIFLPAAGYAVSNALDTKGSYGWYWSSDQTSGYNAAGLVLSSEQGILTYGAFFGYGYSIRPVLNEDEDKGHALTYRVHYVLDSASPFIGGTISAKSGSTALESPIYVENDVPLTVTMTPEGTNQLASFTINGKDHSSDVTLADGVYTWTGTLNEDMNIECSYAKADGKKFTWTSGEGGTVSASYDYMVGGQTAVRTPLVNNQVLDNGTKVYLSVTPDFGYSLDKFMVNGEEQSSATELTLSADTKLEVTFKKNEVTGEERTIVEDDNMEIVDHTYYTTSGKCYGWWQVIVHSASAGSYAINLGTGYGYTSPIGHWTLDQFDTLKDWGYTYIFDRRNNKIYMSALSIDVEQIAPFKFSVKGEALDEDGNHYTISLVATDYDDKVEGYEEKDPEPVVEGIESLNGSNGSNGLNGLNSLNGKFLKDGQIVIRHNGRNYNVLGY